MESVKQFYDTILKSSHPIILSFHLATKAIPIIVYLFGSSLWSFTAQFIIIVLLLSIDFYVTKNITGRKLVQLRWWNNNNQSEDSKSPFIFESYKQYSNYDVPAVNPTDSKLFWMSTYITPVIWLLFGLLCVLKFQFIYMLLVLLAIGLTAYNAYAYRCCDRWDPATADSPNSESWSDNLALPNFDGLRRLATLQSMFSSR